MYRPPPLPLPQLTRAHLAHLRSKTEFASRVITTAPDVTTSTNLIGFVNQRGVFGIEVCTGVVCASSLAELRLFP